YAVVVSGLEQLDDAAVQEIDVGHIRVGAVGRALLVPRPEHVLLAIAEPEPQQVRAVEARHQRLQVAFEPRLLRLAGKYGKAIAERHSAALRMTRGEFHCDLRAGVPAIRCGVLDAEYRQRLRQSAGKI